MNITFDKSMKQRVFQMLSKTVKNKECPFCGKPVRGNKQFAGAFHYFGEPRFMHGNIICLIQYAGYIRGIEILGKEATKK